MLTKQHKIEMAYQETEGLCCLVLKRLTGVKGGCFGVECCDRGATYYYRGRVYCGLHKPKKAIKINKKIKDIYNT